jgi:hypothetical protein
MRAQIDKPSLASAKETILLNDVLFQLTRLLLRMRRVNWVAWRKLNSMVHKAFGPTLNSLISRSLRSLMKARRFSICI